MPPDQTKEILSRSLVHQISVLEAERDALRALLREARPYVNSIPAANRRETVWVNLRARIDALLNPTGSSAPESQGSDLF